MKKFVLSLAIRIVVTGTFLLFSFTSKKNIVKPFTTTTYYYVTGTCYQEIAGGIVDEDCRYSSLDQNTFKNINNWTTTSNTNFSDNPYIAAITFNQEYTADGGLDGQLTLAEALDALWNYYVTQCPKDLPSDHQSILKGTAFITVFRKAAVN